MLCVLDLLRKTCARIKWVKKLHKTYCRLVGKGVIYMRCTGTYSITCCPMETSRKRAKQSMDYLKFELLWEIT